MKKTMGVLFLLIIGGISVSATFNQSGMWHDANDIGVTIGGYTMSLQEATDGHFIAGPDSPTSHGTFPINSHNASDFLITIDGFTMTIQEAIKINAFTFGATQDGPITANIHTADEINIVVNSIEVSFQDAITNNDITCQAKTCADFGYDCGIHDNQCGGISTCPTCSIGVCTGGRCIGECVPGSVGAKDCDSLDTSCRDYKDVPSICSSDGYWQGTCNLYTNAARGSDCGDPDKACDSVGVCIGWSSANGDSCPGTTITVNNIDICKGHNPYASCSATVYRYSGLNFVSKGKGAANCGTTNRYHSDPIMMKKKVCVSGDCTTTKYPWSAKPAA